MDIPEMIALVQAYINHRKGVTVQIRTSPLNLVLLIQAHNIARAWFKENAVK